MSATEPRGISPAALGTAQGQRDSNLIQLAPVSSHGIAAGSQSPRRKTETASIHNPYLNPNHAAKAIPASVMMTSGQSVGSRSSGFPLLMIGGFERLVRVEAGHWYSLRSSTFRCVPSRLQIGRSVRAERRSICQSLAGSRQQAE